MINEIPEETMKKLEIIAQNISKNLSYILNTTKPITENHIKEHEGKWPIEKQYLRVYQEVGEAEKAYTRKLPDEDEEHMDIFFSWLTLAHLRDKTEQENYNAILDCIIKFHMRGWL